MCFLGDLHQLGMEEEQIMSSQPRLQVDDSDDELIDRPSLSKWWSVSPRRCRHVTFTAATTFQMEFFPFAGLH